jgi:acyl dehydratase
VGTISQAQEWIGTRRTSGGLGVPLSSSMVQLFAGTLEDGDSRWWDEGLCPPGLTMAFGLQLPWRPGGPTTAQPLVFEIPLPGDSLIGSSIESQFLHFLRVGDRVTVTEEVLSISEPKTTVLGEGHFVTIRWSYTDQDDRLCATDTVVSFRFDAVRGPAATRSPSPPDRPRKSEEGDLPPIVLPISFARVCQAAAATWDWFPGHFDPEYARAQGLPTIYVDALFVQGLVDRLATKAGGPDAFITRRKIRMLQPLFAERTATVSGKVISSEKSDGSECKELTATIHTEDGLCVTAELTVRGPA